MHDEAATAGPTRSLSVLVVEDEFLVAMDVELMLEENGHSVVGPAATVEHALRLLETVRPDVALLDANLRGQPVLPVAALLRERGIPYVLASAYTSFAFDSSNLLSDVVNVGKPIAERVLMQALGDAVGHHEESAVRSGRRNA